MRDIDDPLLIPAASNLSGNDQERPKISIVLCTLNRAHYLRSALASIFDQGETRWSYELLLVDNCSTDETPEIGHKLAERGLLRYVHAPKLGLCHARNDGWRAARGEIVAYFDDDALAEPGWLDAIAEAFSQTPMPGVVGGKVIPIWEAERPTWLSDGIALSLTIVDWSPVPKDIPDVRTEWLVGANMAMPRHVIEEVGGFDPRLDRIGTNMLSGGDVHIQQQIIDRGYRCFYQPDMAIRHLAAKSRLNQPWFERRYYWQGISDAVMTLIADKPGPAARLGKGIAALFAMLTRPRDIALLLRSTNDPAIFEQRCFAFIRLGYALGLLGKARI
jgi:glycosyltransferase involved in cell wall biosynthesis